MIGCADFLLVELSDEYSALHLNRIPCSFTPDRELSRPNAPIRSDPCKTKKISYHKQKQKKFLSEAKTKQIS